MTDRIRDTVIDLEHQSRSAYLKNGNEIILGLERLNIQSMTTEQSFMFYYFACEWLAKILYGISANKNISELKNPKFKFNVEQIRKAKQKLNLSITTEELDALFYTKNDNSARKIRNNVAHEFGQKSLQKIAEHETNYIPIFEKLLKEWEGVAALLNRDSTVLPQK